MILRGLFVVLVAAAASANAASITSTYPDYAPGETAVLVGSEWLPGETVEMIVHEDPTLCPDRTLTAIADENGAFTNTELVMDEHDLGVTFLVTATGLTSALTAQTSFTDGCGIDQTPDPTCPLTNLQGNCIVGCRSTITGDCDPTRTGVAAAGTVCRAPAGVCDLQETCNGSGPRCPTDGFASPSTVCRAKAGICDVPDHCTGAGPDCTADGFEPTTTLCRAKQGICDIADYCTGAAAACPANALEPSTTVCRAQTSPCDIADYCSGTGAACPTNNFAPSGTVCRAAAGVCDVAETCTGSAPACPSDGFKANGTACGDASVTPCTTADTCNGSGTCKNNHRECGFVTSSALCPFDVNLSKGTCDGGGASDGTGCKVGVSNDPCVRNGGVCVPSNQFRLIFTPDVQSWIAYKLNASNPGQFFYNLIAQGTPGDTIDLAIEIPYPFVTQGATPVHVYDGSLPTVGGCFVPGASLASSDVRITLADWLAGTSDGTLDCDQVLGPNGSGVCRFVVPATIPAGGSVYVNVHLDFALKGPGTDANPFDTFADRYDRGATASPWASYDALKNTSTDNGPLALRDCRDFTFAHENETTAEVFTDTVQNLNDFKRIAGVFGSVVLSANGNPGAGAHMQLVRNSTGTVVASATADADGAYGMTYKHKGSAAMYTVYALEYGLARAISLSGNGWAEVSFDPSTGTSSVNVKK